MNDRLRLTTIHAIEADVEEFHITKKKLQNIEECGRRSTLATFNLVEQMQRTVEAIQTAYNELPEQRRRWVALRYWQKKDAYEAADEAGTTERNARRWRYAFVSRIAELLGKW